MNILLIFIAPSMWVSNPLDIIQAVQSSKKFPLFNKSYVI